MDRIEETLTSLLSTVSGASMAAMLGMDGVSVQMALSDAWQVAESQVIEVELASLAEAVQKAAAEIAAETSTEFFLSTAKANFLAMMVSPSYFVVLGLEPHGDLALAREALGEAQQTLGDLGIS